MPLRLRVPFFVGTIPGIPAEDGSKVRSWPWCLWCLFEAEIGAIHAKLLKELQHATQ